MIKNILCIGLFLTLFTNSVHAAEPPWWQALGLPAWPSFVVDVPDPPAPDDAAIRADVSGNATEDDYTQGQETGGFNLFELMGATIEGIPDCIDYCITGIDIRYKFPAKIIFAALLRHNNADLIMEIYPSLSKVDLNMPQIPGFAINEKRTMSPWREWADVMGTGQYKITKGWASQMYSELGFDGGTHLQADFGNEQQHGYKEAHAIGHPYVLIPYLLDTGTGEIDADCQEPEEGTVPVGQEPTTGPTSDACLSNLPGHYQQTAQQELADQEPDPITDEDPDWMNMTPEELADEAVTEFENQVTDYVVEVQQCSVDLRCLLVDVLGSQEFQRIFRIVDTIEDSVETIRDAVETIQTIADVAAFIATGDIGWEVRVDRLLCPSEDITALMPYYLSGVDPQWRSGLIDIPPYSFPNDPHKVATIINPFSADRVGQNNELWGHIYPRSGVYNHSHDAKAAMLVTKRLEDIVIEPQRRRLRWNEYGFGPSEDGWHGKWQMLYPYKLKTCEIEPWTLDGIAQNVHGDFMYPAKESRYAYNYWREKKCGTTTRGSRVTSFDIPEICF